MDDRLVVEPSTMQLLRGGSRAVDARIPDGSGEDSDVAQRCAHLIDKASFTNPGDVGGERVDEIISHR